MVVDVDFGSIEIAGGTGSKVLIQVTRRVSRGSKEEEEAFLSERPVLITQEGQTVTVKSRSESSPTWNIWRGFQRREARYTITVPEKFDIRAKTSGGSIRVSHCEGDLKIHTSGGGIDVGGGKGTLTGSTSGGSVSVKSFTGDMKVRTSGGSIHIDGAGARVEASTSGGSVSASLPKIAGPVRLETSGGSVTLHTSSDAAFDLDASTSGGGASSEIPVQVSGKPSRHQLKGPVNGGGERVQLRSSGGSVRVKKL